MNTITAVPRRGFTSQEFEARVERAQAIMRHHKLDAVLVTTPANFRYFTGWDSEFWITPTRPFFLIVPLDGLPIAVVPEIGAASIANTWINDIRTWPAPVPEDDGVSLLKATLESLRSEFGRVGAELGAEMSLRMPVVDFLRLRDSVSSEIVDGSRAIWEMRLIKSAAEIAHVGHICEILNGIHEDLPGMLSIGQTEREISQMLRAEFATRGTDDTPFLATIAGPGGYAQIIDSPTDRVIEKGDVLFVDTGCRFDGYFCDFDRNYAFGEISREAARAHETLWLATEAGLAAAIPGATCNDVWRAMAEVLNTASGIGSAVGRFGHSFGLQITEPPSFRNGDNVALAENMVFAIEPSLQYAPNKMLVHEENFVITSGGARLLSKRTPREMPIVR